MRRILFVFAAIAISSVYSFAQSENHIIAQVADGAFGDGTSYRTTFMILPWFNSPEGECLLELHGMTATLTTQGNQTFLNESSLLLPLTGGVPWVIETGRDQPFQSGFATLECADYVFATALYSFHAPNAAKLAEATVFSTEGAFNTILNLIVDERNGARLGVAIANPTALTRMYELTFADYETTMAIPGRSSQAQFLDEMNWVRNSVPTVWPTGQVGALEIRASDFTNFGAIGLRYSGTTFTTIPATD